MLSTGWGCSATHWYKSFVLCNGLCMQCTNVSGGHLLPCVQVANGFSEEVYKVIYKRPSDLSLKADVPVCCNILICDMFDEGAPASSSTEQSP